MALKGYGTIITHDISTELALEINGNEEVDEVAVGGCHQMILDIEVYGYAQTKDGNPAHEINKLLQDVRQVIFNSVETVAEYADRGLAFRMGSLETDQGALAHGGIAAFSQTFHFGYKNNKTW